MSFRLALLFLAASAAFAVDLELIDARTGKPIAGAGVRIWSDNGIRCSRAPCPTNGKEWKGKSNAAGVVKLPDGFIQLATNVTVSGYDSRNLSPDAQKQKRVTLKLTPGNH